MYVWQIVVVRIASANPHLGRLCPHLGLFMINDTEIFCTITKCLQYSMMKVFSNGRNTLNQQKY